MSEKKIANRFLLVLLLAIGINVDSYAESDFQSWNALALTGDVDDKGQWQFWFDGHLRFKEDASRLGVSIVRPGIGYNLSNDTTLKWRVEFGYLNNYIDSPGSNTNFITNHNLSLTLFGSC